MEITGEQVAASRTRALGLLGVASALGVVGVAAATIAPASRPAPAPETPHHLVVHSTLSASDGATHAHHDADETGHALSAAGAGVVSVAATPTGNGWWDTASDGSVYSFGDAVFHGSMGGAPLNQPIVGIAGTPSGQGYWLVARDGGIFSFGDAAFHGSTGAIHLNQPIVGMTSTPSGQGYNLVAADGGIFSFGDAAFHGSTGAIHLNRPIVGMASTPTGQGYWMVATDGGIFNFGDAPFVGSAGAMALRAPVAAMAPSGTGQGYYLVVGDGQVLTFGDAAAVASGAGALGSAVVGATPLPGGRGVRLVAGDGSSLGLSPGVPVVASSVPTGNTNAFSYLVANADGSPARFNPCAAIHYVTNLGAAPAGAAAMVSGALDRISTASGMSFVNDGPTTEIPNSGRPAVQPTRYGNSWAPVVIAWAHTSQSDLLPGGNTIGEGGSSWVSQGGPKIFVTGEVVIDADSTANLPVSFGSGSTLGELVLHELGHVMGLGHSSDPNQLMYPSLVPVPVAAYGAGDLNGLTHLGRPAGCLTTPQP
ncbi:MAG: hypothetical protein NVS3B21_03020 [Acidimicrobiales bacterium]